VSLFGGNTKHGETVLVVIAAINLRLHPTTPDPQLDRTSLKNRRQNNAVSPLISGTFTKVSHRGLQSSYGGAKKLTGTLLFRPLKSPKKEELQVEFLSLMSSYRTAFILIFI